MPPSLLKRRMFSFGSNKAERKDSVVRSSAWPSSDPVESETKDSLEGCFLEDKGSAVKKAGRRGKDVVVHAEGKQGKDVMFHHGDDDDDVLIKAMREDSDEHDSVWLTEGGVDEEGMREISSEAVNVLPSIGALEETLFTDTNTESLIRLVRQLHEEDEEIDPSILMDEGMEYYAQPAAVDTHSLLKAATASKLGEFEDKLESISKVLNTMVSESLPGNSIKENLSNLERRVGTMETTMTISMTNQDTRLCAFGHVVEGLREELEAIRKSCRIMDIKYDRLVNRLDALSFGVVSKEEEEEEKDRHHHADVIKRAFILLLKNIGMPLLTALIAHRHMSKKS